MKGSDKKQQAVINVLFALGLVCLSLSGLMLEVYGLSLLQF